MRWSQGSAAERDWGSQDSGIFESGGEGKIEREVGEGLGNEAPLTGPAHTQMSTSLKTVATLTATSTTQL